jgi:hypothetical protein
MSGMLRPVESQAINGFQPGETENVRRFSPFLPTFHGTLYA